jgi:hypothetical protein
MRKTLLAFALGLSAYTAAPAAFAADEGPCGNFDFSAGVSCKVEVEGGCTAACDPLKVEVACGGKCTATADTQCTDTCGESCLKECDPHLLDCFQGCHAECDQPAIDVCKKDHPEADCVTQAKAQCDVHCNDNCKVPDTSCEEHCHKCCVGSCQTQVNFDCDFKCSLDVQVSCKAQCTKPSGGIFCNGQFVNATDVDACIKYLAAKNLNVDVSARGSAACTGSNCNAEGSLSFARPDSGGCSTSPPGSSNGVTGTLGLVGLAWAVSSVLRARRQRQ